MAVYGYTRVSTAQQVDGTSLSEQRRRIQAIADFHGWTVDDYFEDRAVSGGDALHTRPAGNQMLALLKPGDTLIVSKLDRLFRSAEDALQRTNKWMAAGIDLVLGDVSVDPVTRDGVGRLFFTMLAAMAEFERNRINERTAAGREAKKAEGGYLGGHVPFGYERRGKGKNARLVPHPTLFEARAKMIAARLRGDSLREIRRFIEEKYAVRIGLGTIARVTADVVPSLPRNADALPPPIELPGDVAPPVDGQPAAEVE